MRTTLWNSQSGLSLRLSVIGVPTYTINPFVGLLCKWIACSGEEWTVKRCKSLKLALIQQRAGVPITCSLAKNRKKEIKGVVGSLMRWAMKSDKNFFKVLNAFMAYSHWVSVQMTATQKKKFIEAVSAKPVAIPASFLKSFVKTTKRTIRRRTIRETPDPLIFWRGSPTRRAPTRDNGSVNQQAMLLSELSHMDTLNARLHVMSLWTGLYEHVFEGIDLKTFLSDLSDKGHKVTCHPMVAGEVHFIQEPGHKLRSIASPYRLFQVASQPLKNDLGELVRGLEWDCTHDQAKAIPFIQKALSDHKTVYSVDLSSATDYFPYELQMTVLETVYGEDNPFVKQFGEVSKSYWRSELGMIVWRKGQPLGFNPSFFTFTLTHGLLLLTLLGKKYNHEFFVLGDDVVILNKELFEDYISLLKELNCPYSPDKTLVSSELAEFAGKVITSDNKYPQLKWRKVSDDNFLDLAREIGPRIRLLLTSKQNKVLDVFAHIPPFIHPYGLNWSYPGSNLSEMIRIGMKYCFEDRVLDSLTGLSRRANSQLYVDYSKAANDPTKYVDSTYVSKVVSTFDEKVKSVFLRLGFGYRNDSYFLDGLKDIPSALCVGPNHHELPPDEKLPTRVTLVQRLSRIIRSKG